MTCNLFNGRTDPDSFEALLDDVQPVVVAAQEVGPGAAEVLERRFRHGVVVSARDCTGRALVSSHPVEVQEIELPGRPGLAADLAVGPRGVTLSLLSVHLSNPVDGRRAMSERGEQVDRIIGHVTDLPRVLVVGDLNASPIWRSYRRLTAVLDDQVALWSTNGGGPAPRTWGPAPGGPALLRIDHVLGRGIRVVDVRSHRVVGGDHRALAVEVELP